MILLGATDSSSNDEAITLSWCTNEYGNEIMSSTTRIPMIQIMEIDNDDDGTIDSARLEVRVPIKSNERVHKVWALALFEYKLKDFVQVEWEAAAVVDEQSSLPGRGLVVDGEFSLHQRDLFSAFQRKYVVLFLSISLFPSENETQQTSTSSASALYADQTMLEAGMDASVEDFLPENLLRNYTARDFMSVYEYRYPVWLPRTSELPVDQSFSYFDLNITVRFPTDTIQYRPNFGETLKHGLMQYIPFYIVIAPLIAFVKHFLFEHQVIETEVVSEMPYGSQKLHRF